ncbi:MAG: transposase family protein [Desulfobacteraceae bacterium]|nr:transposase family protein [Desulfobacteraceae bacterium]
MTKLSDTRLGNYLKYIEKPQRHNTRHLLHDMLLNSLCAIISGTDAWTQVPEYGRSKATVSKICCQKWPYSHDRKNCKPFYKVQKGDRPKRVIF